MLHAHGVSPADLGVGRSEFTPEQSRNAFGILCSHWKAYRVTPVKFWLESELADIFGFDQVPLR
jgi:glucuronate isomerase